MTAAGLPPLTRDELLALDDRPVVPFYVPEWGREVCLRAPALPDVVAVADRVKKASDPVSQAKEFLVLGLVTPDGKPFLTAEDADALVASKNMGALQRIARKISELCGVTEAPQPEGK